MFEASNRCSGEISKFQESSKSLGNMDVREVNLFFIEISPDHFVRETGTFIYHLFIEQYLFALLLIALTISDGYHFIMRTI